MIAAHSVVWHDIECGAYTEDLPLWRELAAECDGPVLDIGAGTGRVALDLARAGHEVIALDDDAELIAELERRTGDLPVRSLVADARDFTLDQPVALAIVPMQTVQLLGGPSRRLEFLACARRSLGPGGILAIAIADALQATVADDDILPTPDMCEIDGVVYSSRPMSIVDEGPAAAIHRLREVVATDGTRDESTDVIRLSNVDAATLEAEGAASGLHALPRHLISETDDYVGSTVVMFRA
ncbi:MAG TPA: class I SAM-dependent methyltransferase [Baekduia sp.]|nr:class I SAM-dependent methyltransferase [Baekduia sp.]